MNDIVPSADIQEGLSGFFKFIPYIYTLVVAMSAIAFEIVDLDGTIAKKFYLKIASLCIIYAGITYLFYPKNEAKISDIPTLLVGSVAAIFLMRIFAKWRQNKKEKRKK